MSSTEKPLISIPLDIPDVTLLEVEVIDNGAFIITVESRLEGTHCRRCGNLTTEFHQHDEWIKIRHLPILDRPVYLRLRPKRYKCLQCSDGPTTTQKLQWREQNSPNTKAYDEYLLKRLINSTLEDVACKEAIGYEAVEGAIDRQVAAQVDWSQYERLETIGIDEIALRKGHRDFITIVTVREEGGKVGILGVLGDKKKQTIKNFLQSIPLRLRKTIKSVCTDLYDGFIYAVKEVIPRARRVADRFHVAKAYSEGVEKLRKKEMKRLKKQLPEAEYKKLRGAMWAMRKRRVELTQEEEEVLKQLFGHAPELRRAYELREELRGIFEQDLSKQEAEQEIALWEKRVEESGVKCYEKFIVTLKNWKEEITNYFVQRESSGFVEGVNNKIKVMKRRCYGIFDLKRLYQRLYLDFGGYERFCNVAT